MRYERKYRIEASNLERVRTELLANPVGFIKSYPDRVVNSIYYDDINYSSYNDNLLGIGNRVKYRIRWYGDNLNNIHQPLLEKKIKRNLLGTKEYFTIKPFTLAVDLPSINQEINLVTNQLFPHIIVRYKRSYYESMDRKLRATIDSELQYSCIINGKLSHEINQDEAIILEIKYDQGNEELANDCMQMIPYRLTKNSKYVSAMRFYLL